MFKEGVLDNRKVGKLKHEDGTEVTWCPSEEFFTNTGVDFKKIRELFHILTCLCTGLTIKLTIDGNEEVFSSSHGLNDLVDDKVKDSEIIHNRMNMNFENGKNKMDMVLTYTSNYSMNMVSYVNAGDTDAGPHITTVKAIITREFNRFFREKLWLKDNEENLSGDDIQEGMFVVFNITTPGVSYDAQTKSRVVKLDMSPFTQAIIVALQDWMLANESDVKIIADKALAARKAREAAKKARDSARAQSKKKEKALKFDSKLADCKGKPRSECEIYITEGKRNYCPNSLYL